MENNLKGYAIQKKWFEKESPEMFLKELPSRLYNALKNSSKIVHESVIKESLLAYSDDISYRETEKSFLFFIPESFHVWSKYAGIELKYLVNNE